MFPREHVDTEGVIVSYLNGPLGHEMSEDWSLNRSAETERFAGRA